MRRLFLLSGTTRRDPDIENWLEVRNNALGAIAHHWFEVMRACGDDVREILHDGHPTACVGEAAFAYVNAFKSHVNVGFFAGAELADPDRLLVGAGKFMRHVKIEPGVELNGDALKRLIEAAYLDMRTNGGSEPPSPSS